MNVNMVILGGNLTRDPEVKFTQANNAVANFAVAVNRKWTDGAGEKREEVTFVECEAWGKTAETIGKFLTKGRGIFVVGRLKFDEWQDKTTGQKRSRLKVNVESFQFVDKAQGGGGASQEEAKPETAGASRRPPDSLQFPLKPERAPTVEEEDIPF